MSATPLAKPISDIEAKDIQQGDRFMLLVEVLDTGPGLEDQRVDALFRPFYGYRT